MQNVSSSYLEKIKEPSRSFECRVTIGNNVYTNSDIINISIEDVQPSDGFTIGAAVSKSLELTLNTNNTIYSNSKVKLEMGLNIGSTFEYILIGHFHIEDIISTDYSTKLTCYDNMIKFEKPYFSNLGKTSSLKNIVNELATITEVEFTGSLPSYNLNKLEGFTCREILGFVASICGGNAYITRDGKFTIKTPETIDYSITSDNYIDLKSEEDLYKLGAITCKANDKELTKGTLSNSSMEITFENPWVTESILTDIYNKLKGFEFIGYSMKWQGDFSLDVGDIISITDIKGNTRQVPIFSQKFTYNGGLTSEIGAKGESKTKNEFSPTGDLNNKVNRVVTDLLIVNKALINKADIEDLKTVNAEIENLIAVNVTITGKLSAIEGEFGTIKSDVATIGNLTVTHTAQINDLIANSATITQLEAVSAKIGTVEAEVGKIETLLSGNLSSENIQTGGITSDKLTIANGFITNAMIANLDVSKINAGDISTNKFRIISDDGGIEIVGATQQFKDKNNRVRVQIGRDTQGNFNFIIRGEDGTSVLIDHTGIKEKAITDDLIKSNMIAQDAIGEKQINYNSFVTGFNKDTNTQKIASSKVLLNSENQTLDVAFNTLSTTVKNIDFGGRNLLANTATSEKIVSTGQVNKTGARYSFVDSVNYFEHIKGKEITVAFDWEYIGDTPSGVFYLQTNEPQYLSFERVTISNDNVKGVYTITKKINSDKDTNGVYIRTDEMHGTLKISKIRLVLGNKEIGWIPAPEDTDQAITDVKTVIESQSTTISVMQGQISTAINNTQIVKDGQTILLKDDYNRTVQTIDSMKSTIGSHTTTINEHTGQITGVQTKTNELERNLNSFTSRLATTETKVTEHTTELSKVDNKINNIQISTRNILRYTRDFSQLWGSNPILEDVNGFKARVIQKTNWADGVGRTTVMHSINRDDIINNLKAGTYISISGWIYIDSSVPLSNSASLNNVFVRLYRDETTYIDYCKVPFTDFEKDKWIYFEATQQIQYDVISKSASFNVSVHQNGKVKFMKPTMVIGSKPLKDWTPAPEDVDQAITDAKDSAIDTSKDYVNGEVVKVNKTITNTNSKVSAIEQNISDITLKVSTVEQSQTTINGQVTALQSKMSDVESKITKNAITNVVRESFYTKDEINDKGYQNELQVQQTVNTFELKFQESGGYNLVYNSDFKNGDHLWSISSGSKYYFGTGNWNSPTGLGMAIIGQSGTSLYAVQELTNTSYRQAKTFTLSGLVNISSTGTNDSTGAKFQLYVRVTYDDDTKKYHMCNIDANSLNKWQKVFITFDLDTTKTVTDFRTTISIQNTTKTIFVSQIMLEVGSMISPWCPNSSEVYDGITTIDKDGIMVTSSNVRSKTTMSADGFKITKTDTNTDVFKVNSDGRLSLIGEYTAYNGNRKSGYFGSNQIKFYNWWEDTNEEIAYFYGGKTSSNKRSADIVGKDMFSIGIGSPSSGTKIMEGNSSLLEIYKNTDFNGVDLTNVRKINYDITYDTWINKLYIRSNHVNTNMPSGYLHLNYWKGGNTTSTSTHVKVGNGNNDDTNGALTCGNFKATGTKNCIVETTVGYVGINAYETADCYFGDIGETILDSNGYSYVYIDSIFTETVNTQRKYQVFLSVYGEGTANVVERTPLYFVIKGTPGIEVGYELKAKRKGYEDHRLKREVNNWKIGENHGLDEDYNYERVAFDRKIENAINEEVLKDIENETLQEFISSEVEKSIENIGLMKTIEEGIFNENIN